MKNEDNSIVGSLDLNFMDNKHLFNIKKERVQKEPVSDVGKWNMHLLLILCTEVTKAMGYKDRNVKKQEAEQLWWGCCLIPAEIYCVMMQLKVASAVRDRARIFFGGIANY